MKKYAAAKGHGIRIGGGGKKDATTQKILKRTYLCRHSGKPPKKLSGTSCRVGCPWKVNIWLKKDKNCLEVTALNNEHVGHELHPEQQILWLRYHDVIMHDNTCKTNRYDRPLSIFVTPDNNLKTRIVAQAIVDDETQSSYEWVFKCVKDATGLVPKVFVTDGDPAVNGAVIAQFPGTFHMHCIWHISQNLPKNLKGTLGSNFTNFMKDFYIMRNSITEEKFSER